MPALAFGLKPARQNAPPVLAGQKRKQTLFDDDAESDNEPGVETTTKGRSITPKAANTAKDKKCSNLSALQSAKKYTEDANNVDASIYDYDNAYDSFHIPKEAKAGKEASGPKYMSSLIQSSEVRKRDQLRAQERLLQKERETEGDEFADKEKFVTGAYKAQQDEVRRMEEAEAKREAEEEERKRQGGGMSGFYKDILKKDEERSLQIAKAAQEAATKSKTGTVEDEAEEETDVKLAEKLKKEGAHIIVNDDGEIVDKRQLLSAGLNVAKKSKLAAEGVEKKAPSGLKLPDYSRSAAANIARQSQRERQTRIMAAQLEEMAQKQAQQEAEEQKAMEEKAESQKTDSDVLSAKERYLARKREREEEAKKSKASGAS
jgi:coiled-coil domain-containing protein 55